MLRGMIGEEESSWLPFKFRETKAEMSEREGGMVVVLHHKASEAQA